jgi:hypothetical protein
MTKAQNKFSNIIKPHLYGCNIKEKPLILDQFIQIPDACQPEKLDEDCLRIYHRLLDVYQDCEKIAGTYLNLGAIFFHELMFYLSSAYYRKMYAEYYTADNSDKDNIRQLPSIPYVGFRKTKESHIDRITVTRTRKLFQIISRLYGKRNRKIGILNPALDFEVFSKLLFHNRYQVIFPEKVVVAIPSIEKQRNIVLNMIVTIYSEFGLYGAPNNLISALDKTLSAVVREKTEPPDYSVLVVGTPKLTSRFIIAEALHRDIPTVCLAHGNQLGVDDNPSWGFDDRSFCSHYIVYGKGGLPEVNAGKYILPLSGLQPNYITADSNFIHAKYSKRPIQKLKDLTASKMAYLPIKLLGLDKMGPFVSIYDENYIQWQRILFKQFPDMCYKKHPKQNISLTLDGVKTISAPLETCIEQFDIFIIDWAVSTVAANIIATSKPIIYFNIGIGKLTPKAEEVFRQRCIWIDVDLQNPGNLFEKVHQYANKEYLNKYTSLFCLNGSEKSREETVIQTLNEILIDQNN